MKIIIAVIAITLGFLSFAQEDYVINSAGEKVFCEIYSNTHRVVKAVVNKKDVKYKPDEIQGFMINGVLYESGKVAYGSYGVKIWAFLTVVEDGDMLLCKIESTYYTKDASRSTATTTVKTPLNVIVHYARLKESSNEGYIKIGIKWKKDLATLGEGCNSFAAKVKKAKYGSWSDEEKLESLVKSYNSDCSGASN